MFIIYKIYMLHRSLLVISRFSKNSFFDFCFFAEDSEREVAALREDLHRPLQNVVLPYV